jgi:hypothetical protein
VLRTITGEPGSAAAVLNSGTESDATLTFVIPAGVQGVRGLPGERGEAGAAGLQGATGAAGSPGAPGVTGAQGLQGIPGMRGATGATGAQGIQGIQGVQGENGERGERGVQGIQGVPGERGEQGLAAEITVGQTRTGAPGTDALVFNHGTREFADLDFIIPRGITGPAGATGTQGLQGIPGVRGERGAQGLQGIPGVRGATGATGTQGLQGIPGVRGERGERGERGAQGIEGIPGATGATGTQGLQGIPGERGARGERGERGERGAQGIQGIQGVPGIPGERGATGATGAAAAVAFGGMFNGEFGSFELHPDEVVALHFSDLLPGFGVWYDDHHSIVTESAGVYEISYQLRGEGLECGKLQLAVTNDGALVPGSVLTQGVSCREPFAAAGSTLAAVDAGAHLHFILFSKKEVKLLLQEGVNATLTLQKLGDLPEDPAGYLPIDSAD